MQRVDATLPDGSPAGTVRQKLSQPGGSCHQRPMVR